MSYFELEQKIKAEPSRWLITGVAGFIGSNLLEKLLKLDQHVIGLDNFSTGHKSNLVSVKLSVSDSQWSQFSLIEGDIRNINDCMDACKGVDYILHQAALGSVPRSIEDPILTNANNVDGFLNMLVAAKNSVVKKFVYAASSSTYGDHPDLPKVENIIGKPLSPYAVSKFTNELYAEVFFKTYGLNTIGLRYFNIFGRRQDPNGAYAAVIPKWINALISGQAINIYGDGDTSRDFCYIDNAIQANILAATTQNYKANNEIYNVAYGERTSLNDLYMHMVSLLEKKHLKTINSNPIYLDYRTGDVKHSLADISKAKNLLGYMPTHNFSDGLVETVEWYSPNY